MRYVLTFDLDTETLKKSYPSESWNNAYADIRKVLYEVGFTWQQGSVYFGENNITAVQCVLAAQKLSNSYCWFKSAVRDIKMLRIEEITDLTPAL